MESFMKKYLLWSLLITLLFMKSEHLLANAITTDRGAEYNRVYVDGFSEAWMDLRGLIWSERKGYATYQQAIDRCSILGGRLPKRKEIYNLLEDFGAKQVGLFFNKFDLTNYRPQVFSDIPHVISDARKAEYSQNGIWYDDGREDEVYGNLVEWHIHLESLTFWYSYPDSMMSFRCVIE